jgi:hypothetical protein
LLCGGDRRHVGTRLSRLPRRQGARSQPAGGGQHEDRRPSLGHRQDGGRPRPPVRRRPLPVGVLCDTARRSRLQSLRAGPARQRAFAVSAAPGRASFHG